MNTAVLKSPGFWIALIAALAGLLINQGVILSGSTLDTVLSYVLTLAGVLTGHMVSMPAAPAAPAAPSAPAAS